MIKKFPKYTILIFAIFLMSLVIFTFINTNKKEYFEISFLDVGQGDSVLITSPNGNRLLYDSGTPDNKVEYSVEKELRLFDRDIDIFVASHPDADHIGGFQSLVNKFNPSYYLDGHTIAMTSLFSSLESTIDEKHINRNTLGMGSNINLGGGVVAYVLAPTQDESKEYLDSNSSSVVLLIKYGESKVLLTGDLEEKGESKLINTYGGLLKSNILKVGHHGSKSSTGNKFIEMVKPEFSIISVGKNNRYGHPNIATINRLMYSSTTIFDTSKSGTIRFRCNKITCSHIQS